VRGLVIGGNGFIGSHLVDRLAADGSDVAVLDVREPRFDPMPPTARFIRGRADDESVLREALADVEVVFHLAWGTIPEVSERDPAADVQANLVPTIHVLDACQRAGIRRFVFTSSGGTVYGPARQLPIPETHPREPITAYGITKLAAEQHVQTFCGAHGLDYAILRPSTPYGPRQNPLGRQGAVSIFLYRIARGLPIALWGDGSTTRDYFFVTDLVQALVACASAELREHRIFNIGGGVEVSLRRLVEIAEAVVGKKASVTVEAARSFDVPRLALDTRLARQELGWTPTTQLAEGMHSTWQWISRALPR
jgi:UDP-glucose 4-epimerase